MSPIRVLAAMLIVSVSGIAAQAQPASADQARLSEIEAEMTALRADLAATKATLETFQGNVMLHPAIIKPDGTAEPILATDDPTIAAAKQKGTLVAVPLPIEDVAEQLTMMMILGEIRPEKAKNLIDSFKTNAGAAKLHRAELQANIRLLEMKLQQLESARQLLANRVQLKTDPSAIRPAEELVSYDLYQADAKNPSQADRGSGKPFVLTLRMLENGQKCRATLDLGKEFADSFKEYGLPFVVQVEGTKSADGSYQAKSKDLEKLVATVAEVITVLPYSFIPGAEKPALGSKVNDFSVVLRQEGDQVLVSVMFDVTVRVSFKGKPAEDSRVRDKFQMVGVPKGSAKK